MICLYHIAFLSFLKLKYWGRLLDVHLILEENLNFPQFGYDI